MTRLVVRARLLLAGHSESKLEGTSPFGYCLPSAVRSTWNPGGRYRGARACAFWIKAPQRTGGL